MPTVENTPIIEGQDLVRDVFGNTLAFTHTPLYLIIAALCAFFISVTLTPVVRTLAFKFKITDIPKDNRRMHKKEMPLMGGLAIFIAFVSGVLMFCELDIKVVGMLLGALVITVTGIIDDKYDMKPIIKLLLQICAALIAVLSGNVFEQIVFFGEPIVFGRFSWLVTVVWIVALTNAINLIDGLDGLSCGISTISCVALLVSLFYSYTPFSVIVMIAILAGSCLGFLPFNFNPAKIFMGDTGALFLGYTLSVLSIMGCFKMNAIVSFWVPFFVFALPIIDTAFAFIRRILTGRSPFSADRGHLHHRLIDKGFDQRHAVMMLYAIAGISGISAILISVGQYISGFAVLIGSVLLLILNMKFSIFNNPVSSQNECENTDETEGESETNSEENSGENNN